MYNKDKKQSNNTVSIINRCKPGFFNLAMDNEFGCTPCFCYGHSSVCRPATGYSKVVIESMFVRGTERWKATVAGNPIPLHYDPLTQTIYATALDRDNAYFIAPGKNKYIINSLHFLIRTIKNKIFRKYKHNKALYFTYTNIYHTVY